VPAEKSLKKKTLPETMKARVVVVVAALASLVNAQALIQCPSDIVNVSAPVTLDATTAATRFGVLTHGATAVTWGGGFQFRSLSFDSLTVSSATIADCIFAQMSLTQQLAASLPTTLALSCAGVVRSFNVTQQAYSLVTSVAFGQVPATLAAPPVGDFPGAHDDNLSLASPLCSTFRRATGGLPSTLTTVAF
jgi:hypothetical protein